MSNSIINLDKLNKKIPGNYLWDGFWIDSYKRQTLNISAAFDKIYSRDFMIVYKGVSFFNVPYQWRDTEIKQPWMRFADKEKFIAEFPNEDISNKSIIEWQLLNSFNQVLESFYIVCKKVYVFKCEGEERNYAMTYQEPIPDEDYLKRRFDNRVPIWAQFIASQKKR